MTEQPKDIVLSNNDMHPAEEIAHLKDLLGKANALARIRAERIKELEAQAGAEPVAWMTHESKHRLKNGGNSKGSVPVHKNPSHTSCIPLYTHPPARVPLTDEELRMISKQQDPVVVLHHNVLAFAHAIIAAYEAKNGIGGGK